MMMLMINRYKLHIITIHPKQILNMCISHILNPSNIFNISRYSFQILKYISFKWWFYIIWYSLFILVYYCVDYLLGLLWCDGLGLEGYGLGHRSRGWGLGWGRLGWGYGVEGFRCRLVKPFLLRLGPRHNLWQLVLCSQTVQGWFAARTCHKLTFGHSYLPQWLRSISNSSRCLCLPYCIYIRWFKLKLILFCLYSINTLWVELELVFFCLYSIYFLRVELELILFWWDYDGNYWDYWDYWN